MIGRTVSHYRILGRLGVGGMGEVFEAEDTKLHRRVALKVLLPEVAADPERLARFEREARAVAKLNHPNIVTVYSIEEDDGLRFLTMERVEGRTLSESIPGGGLTAEKLTELAVPLADALSAAHEAGVTHRDLKPGNVMLTPGGAPKILDFGLAKVRRAGDEEHAASVLETAELTGEGRILGTFPYMSPEQLHGAPADARSDIFSLGVMLYEMATGRRPFQGRSSADLISAILRDEPPSPDEVKSTLPRQLGRIIAHCLEKDPDRRFQTAKDLRNELQSLARELQTAVLLGAERPAAAAAGRRAGAALAAVVIAALLAAGGWWLSRQAGRSPPAPARESPRGAIAVLPFDNLRQDPELDWLSDGLAEMLVIELSRSPELEVLSSGSVYRAIEELELLERPSREILEPVASRTGAATMLFGSFARAGDTYQITVHLEDPGTGAALASHQERDRGEASLFSMVDDLGRAIRGSLDLRDSDRPEFGRALREVTTPSVEAYRYYTEAMRLHNQIKENEAIVLLEKAVELDPGFALALSRLATIHFNLGHPEESREYARRAFEHAERSPAYERYYIEGSYYGTTWRTFSRAAEAYQRGLDLYPDRNLGRTELGYLYGALERYDEALDQYRTLMRHGTRFGGSYYLMATMFAAQGRFEEGLALLEEFVDATGGGWFAHLSRFWHLARWGRLEEAGRALAAAEAERPEAFDVIYARWLLAALEERWPDAEREAARMAAGGDANSRWWGLTSQAADALFRGRGEEAVARRLEAARVYPESESLAAAARVAAADLLLELGDPGGALEQAELARREELGRWPELPALGIQALAAERLGRPVEADRSLETLAAAAEASPNRVETRQLHHFRGLLALERGDLSSALGELRRAAELLPPVGVEVHAPRVPDHVPVWYSLAAAHLAAGEPAEAAPWLRRVTESSTEHVAYPLRYVRSFFLLARLSRELGDLQSARRYAERYLAFWRDGRIDAESLRQATEMAR